jgi:response regulator of citrate/malate metabolism
MSKILLVEDDAWLSELYESAIDEHEVVCAGTADQALETLDNGDIDLVLLDMFLPDHNGIELIHEIASYEDTADIPIIILSAVHTSDFGLKKERMKHYGVVEYLYKPEVKPAQVRECVNKHLRERVV